jgi:hypothetical protein
LLAIVECSELFFRPFSWGCFYASLADGQSFKVWGEGVVVVQTGSMESYMLK